MNFTYENQGASTFLVYAVEEGEQLDSMSVGMITNNNIPGLVKAVFTQMDTSKFIKYNVSSRIPVRQFFSGPINKRRLLGVFQGIVDAVLSAEEYMIDPNMIIIDTDYMFADVSTCETNLICLPVIREEPQNIDLGAFFKRIMFTMQFDQTEDCDYVAKIINYLNRASIFSLEKFKALLTEVSTANGSAPAAPVNAAPSAAGVQPDGPKKKSIQPAPVPAAPKAPVFPGQPAPMTPPPPPVPPAPPVPPVSGWQTPPPAQTPAQAQDTGEKMSLFYLLQHYNKENAAAYKAQKEQKKASKGVGAPPPPAAPQKQKQKQKQKIPAYAVPGQPAVPPMSSAPAAPAAPVMPPMSSAPAAPAAPVMPPMPSAPAAPAVPVMPPVSSAPVMPPMPSAPAAPAQGFPPPPAGGQYGQAPNAFGDFGGTVYLSDDGQPDSATVLLGAGPAARQIVPHLIRKRNGERIPIAKPVFRLGRDVEFNDYAVTDNVYVGHSHCHIVSRDGEYFVVDDNSKNRTYVDGACITSGQEVKLTHGCKLVVANEEFEFKLY